ncbi:MAG TPA: GntR family transcriptional regulator [Chloroflexota bacterium]|nr:GntR family transcriptional regulator [Chloroflexota bacterium]
MSSGRAPGGLERDLLRERARSEIRDAIALGELKPGDQIVEATMAARIGVSRSPVREALRELEQHGLVESVPNRGTFVATLAAEDVEEIVLLRGALEGLAARLAADRMGRRDLRALEETVERMSRHTGPGAQEESAFTEADGEFHSVLVRVAGHRRLLRLWSELDPFIWLMTVNEMGANGERDRDAMAREHRELLDTLASGNPEEAQRAVWEHIVRRQPQLPSQWPPNGVALAGGARPVQ